ncbi:MAG: shikimate kinase [Clostridia bacterium]|nr:shikimate kinase [Clostridia bacterium]
MKNLALIGMPGSGKTIVGKLLAQTLKCKFIDTDTLIEKLEDCSIADLINDKGVEYFRSVESQVLQLAVKQKRSVISTGGGIVLSRRNNDCLDENCIIIYLRTSTATLYNRVKGNADRPLLCDDVKEQLELIYAQRRLMYEGNADLTIDTDNLTVEQVAGQILESL